MSADEPPKAAPIDIVHTKKRFVLRIVLVVLTLALWKGWAEENHFLDMKIGQENQLLQGDASNGFTGLFPSLSQHIVAVNERDNRYHERESEQPFKLIPMVIWTALVGWVAIAPKAKEKLDITLEALNTVPPSGLRGITLVACVVAALGTWLICGHANTGAFAGLVVVGYMYWFGRQKSV